MFSWAATVFYFYCTVAIGAFKFDYRLWNYDLGKAWKHTDSCFAHNFEAIRHFTNDFKTCWFTFKRANLLSHLYSKLWTVFIFKRSSVKFGIIFWLREFNEVKEVKYKQKWGKTLECQVYMTRKPFSYCCLSKYRKTSLILVNYFIIPGSLCSATSVQLLITNRTDSNIQPASGTEM